MAQRILVATPEVLGARRAGPAVRAWHVAAALAADPVGHTVTLAARPGEGQVATPGFSCVPADDATLRREASTCDVLIVGGDLLSRVSELGGDHIVVVSDLYDPYQLEALERTAALDPDHRRRAIWAAGRAIDDLLRRGDLFLCAGGRQRDFWLGALAGAGRINEATHVASPSLEQLLVDVPFGVEDEPPRPGAPVLRGVVPGIESGDVILWWGGGIYEWFDPDMLLEAMAVLVTRHPDVRLVFAGTRHPNPDVGETRAAAATRAQAERLGLTGNHVFFLDWVAYDERGSYLLEADIVVSTHRDQIETMFSYRTRILDALWAGRPVVATGGDALGNVISAGEAGAIVPSGDVGALTEALAGLVADPMRRERSGAAAERLGQPRRWSVTVAPLVEFCRAPRHAPDRLDPWIGPMLGEPGSGPARASLLTRLRRRIKRSLSGG